MGGGWPREELESGKCHLEGDLSAEMLPWLIKERFHHVITYADIKMCLGALRNQGLLSLVN